MQSLRSTFLALGLLGVSFLLYQSSTRPDSSDVGEIPVLEISDGAEGIQELANEQYETVADAFANSSQPNSGSMASASPRQNNFEMPNENLVLSEPEPVTLDDNSFASSGAPASTNQNAPEESKISFPELKPANDFSNQNNGQTASKRDDGLINALQPAGYGSPVTTASGSSDEFEFSSKPIPSNDNSFNQPASNNSDFSKPGEYSLNDMNQGNTNADESIFNIEAAWPRVDELVKQQDYRGALKLLTQFYSDKNLSSAQRERLTSWLDALARKVVFSTEHLFVEQPYLTMPGDNLADLSSRWGVPAQLIYNINQSVIPDTSMVQAGTKLKQIRGPFHGELDLSDATLTLFVDGLYAVRFAVRVGVSGNPSPGSYNVIKKSHAGHIFRDLNGNDFAPGDPQNAYGPNWIGLTNSLCIHAVGESVSTGHAGCIGLNEADSADVFAILGKGSTIKIMR